MKLLQARTRIVVALAAAVCTLGLSAPTDAQSMFGSSGFGENNASDEEPTTLPMVDGGLGLGGWWIEDDDVLGGGLPIGVFSQPTTTLVGYAYHLDLAILSTQGTGFGIVEALPAGCSGAATTATCR